MDVTNLKTFPIHNVDGLEDDYAEIWTNEGAATPSAQRFVDHKETTKAKRVYWGIDPNYKNNKLTQDDADGTTAREAEFTYVEKIN